MHGTEWLWRSPSATGNWKLETGNNSRRLRHLRPEQRPDLSLALIGQVGQLHCRSRVEGTDPPQEPDSVERFKRRSVGNPKWYRHLGPGAQAYPSTRFSDTESAARRACSHADPDQGAQWSVEILYTRLAIKLAARQAAKEVGSRISQLEVGGVLLCGPVLILVSPNNAQAPMVLAFPVSSFQFHRAGKLLFEGRRS